MSSVCEMHPSLSPALRKMLILRRRPYTLQRFTIIVMSTAASTRPQLAHLTAQLDDLRQRGTFFKLRVLDDEQAPVCHYDGKQVINLASNNYLGLCNHPKLREAAIAATEKFG